MPKTKTRRKKTANKILNVALVWDMSGSMGVVREAAVEGAGDYLHKLRLDENVESMRFSITAFDTIFEKWFEDVLIGDLPQSLGHLYHPRGWTALNDAVAHTIFGLDERLKGEREDERVLIVVLTDGLENSSEEFGGAEGTAALAEIVKAREATGRWTFVYLGAGSPASVKATAAAYNIPVGNVASYAAASPVATQDTFHMLSNVTRGVVASAGMHTNTAFADSGYKSVEEQTDEEDQNE